MILSLIISMDYISLHSGCLSNKYLRTFSFIHDVGLRTKHFVNWKEKRYKRDSRYMTLAMCATKSLQYPSWRLILNIRDIYSGGRGGIAPPLSLMFFCCGGKHFWGLKISASQKKGPKGGKFWCIYV